MHKRSIVFVINPVSGTGKQKGIEKTIAAMATKYPVEVSIEFTQRAGHASEIAAAHVAKKTDVVAVVGGDGSVNEVGKTLLHSGTTMAIVPTGSGNGLARHLHIPMKLPKSVENVFTGKTITMDAGRIEDHVFLSTAGFGFDAHIAHIFSKQKKRGFSTYIKSVRKQLFRYEPFDFTVKGEGAEIKDKAFMLSVANIPQFGNNFTINPLATENDGLLNATVIRPFPKYKIPGMIGKFFRKKVHKSKYFTELTGSAFTLEIPHQYAHVDGEPIFLQHHTFTAMVERSCLKIIAGGK